MGEYVNYLGSSMKIGTCENLFYATFGNFRAAFKNGVLSQDEGSLNPADYLKPDSGFRFRFPFPDEDNLLLPAFHTLKDFERGLLVTIDRGALFEKGTFPPPTFQYPVRSRTQPGLVEYLPQNNPNNITDQVAIEIVQQKLVIDEGEVILALCYRCPFCEQLWRIRDEFQAEWIAEQIFEHYIQQASDEAERVFWQTVAERIVAGYRLNEDDYRI